MSSRVIRFATIGTNFITDAFLDASATVQGFQWAAVFSRTIERAQEYAEKRLGSDNNILKFSTLDELVACDEIDAVYIASPTSWFVRKQDKITTNFLTFMQLVTLNKPSH